MNLSKKIWIYFNEINLNYKSIMKYGQYILEFILYNNTLSKVSLHYLQLIKINIITQSLDISSNILSSILLIIFRYSLKLQASIHVKGCLYLFIIVLLLNYK